MSLIDPFRTVMRVAIVILLLSLAKVAVLLQRTGGSSDQSEWTRPISDSTPGETPPPTLVETPGVENATESEATEVPPVDVVGARSWPQSPDATERMIQNILADHGESIASIESVECERTNCEICLTESEWGSLMRLYSEALAGEFISVGAAAGFVRRDEISPGSYQYVIGIGSDLRPRTGPPELTAEDLTKQAGARAPVNEYTREPTLIGTFNGTGIVHQVICSSDCPGNSRRVLWYDLPEGETCEEIGGVTEYIYVTNETGTSERRICVPEILSGMSSLMQISP